MKPELMEQHSMARQTETSAMHPSTKTFGIPELLEVILENAAPRDVLLWQRVNKMWQTAIKSSPRIQEKLFFRIKPCKDKYELDHAIWNPFIDSSDVKEINTGGCRLIGQLTINGKSNYPTASWKQMLITSLAAVRLRTLVYDVGSVHIGKPIVCGSGVTIGQLVDVQAEVNPAQAHSGSDVRINICKVQGGDGDEETEENNSSLDMTCCILLAFEEQPSFEHGPSVWCCLY